MYIILLSFQNKSCAIHVAAQGKEDVVKLLIESKCDVNAVDGVSDRYMHLINLTVVYLCVMF